MGQKRPGEDGACSVRRGRVEPVTPDPPARTCRIRSVPANARRASGPDPPILDPSLGGAHCVASIAAFPVVWRVQYGTAPPTPFPATARYSLIASPHVRSAAGIPSLTPSQGTHHHNHHQHSHTTCMPCAHRDSHPQHAISAVTDAVTVLAHALAAIALSITAIDCIDYGTLLFIHEVLLHKSSRRMDNSLLIRTSMPSSFLE